jgi:uncharacterized protein (TIGR02391 family)
MAANRIPVFDIAMTKGVSDILGQTGHPGLTNPEIDGLLGMVRVSEREPGANKRDSLYRTLHNTQVRQGCGNVLAAFVARAMAPSRYHDEPNRRTDLVDQLDQFLVHYGYNISPDGKLRRGAKARDLSEAAELAGRLHTELRRRDTHAELFRYCAEEFVTRSLFHAISEAAKSIPARVRHLSRLTGDGSVLYDGALGTSQTRPVVYINDFVTDSDISEHRGFKNLLLGIHGHFRNPRAHRNRIDVAESMIDFYDAFGLFSYAHRRLDAARKDST